MPGQLSPQIIREVSQKHGFSLCGVTDPSPLNAFDHYRTWIKCGYHGEMHFLEDSRSLERRANPRLVFPAARSILVLGARYPAHLPYPEPAGLTGLVSAHAWGKDYHLVLQQRAGQMAQELAQISGGQFDFQVAVDSTPLLEKPLAVRAGLGWQGRNSLTNHPHQGSFFFLVEILSPLELEPASALLPDRCGTCQRCREACPTACILPDRTIDARRCLAYQSIENKGSIPRDLRPLFGRRLFGCDACQSACPWNRKAPDAAVVPEFLPRSAADVFPDLVSLIRLTPAEFKSRFVDSSLLRARRRGLLRNAAVVLGNYRRAEAFAPLAFLLQQEADALIRAHAAWGLGQLPSARAREALSAALRTEPDGTVREEILMALESSAV